TASVPATRSAGTIGEVLRNPLENLSPEKRRELTERAAELGLELEADKVRKVNQHQAGWADMGKFVDDTKNLARARGIEQRSEGEFEGASGKVRVEVTTRKRSFWHWLTGRD